MQTMNSMSDDLHTTRGKIFFWIGMVIFPVFWMWWLSRGRFTLCQRWLGRVWAVIYVLSALAAWMVLPEVREWTSCLRWGYSLVVFQVGLGLWVWLPCRFLSLKETIFGLICGVDVWAILASLVVPSSYVIGQEPGAALPIALAFVALPFWLHLQVEPLLRKLHQSQAFAGNI